MKIECYKYQATGNDFILIDNRDKSVKLKQSQIAFLCHRKFGIGADGLMLLEKSSKSDFKMVYFNCDGKQSTMCGNGGRSIVAFAKHLGIIQTTTQFEASDGPHKAEIRNNLVNLSMIDVNTIKPLINALVLNTGSPHYVCFVKNIDELNINKQGAKIRNSKAFIKEGINVNFCEVKNNRLYVRTYERGVEAETLSCGTGVVASAISAFELKKINSNKIQVNTQGGKLKVTLNKINNNNYKKIVLSGEAKQVFKTSIEI